MTVASVRPLITGWFQDFVTFETVLTASRREVGSPEEEQFEEEKLERETGEKKSDG